MRTIYLDGKYLKVNPQILDAFTPGAFRAKGAFETMLGLDGLVMDAALHLQRLRQGLKALKIKPPSISLRVLPQVLQRNSLPCSRVRIMVWQAGKQVHVMATALPYKISPQTSFRVCLMKTSRKADARLSQVKSLDFELLAQAYAKARSRGFDEVLLLNCRGHIFEASRANIFWIKDKVLYTPALTSGCLNGITRRQVIQQARNLKIKILEKNLTPETLKKADAAFLTNSLIGIKPIDTQVLGYRK